MGVRIDKWLWAARFFRTRAKAKEAIDGGKVHLNDNRAKPSKEVNIDDVLQITQGWDEKVVVVKVLSDTRRSATIAQELYEETAESIEKRAQITERRKAAGNQVRSEGRPSKRDRRLIHQFRDKNLS
ncbi:MAG: RNA-binding protein [Gammaproteobacteria bacterium]|jgi:ribosome-associated heat shock protein Hsp15|nr:RNA-binding protein [Gammaproteobacteria bacterium]MBT4493095.1 RNA-binding protein [Gammaproteobacteria bacterium]